MRYFSVKNWGHFQYNEYLSRKVNSLVNFANGKSKIRYTFGSNFCRKIINFTYWVCHVASAKTNEAALFTTAHNSAFSSSRMTSTCLTNSWTESSFVTSEAGIKSIHFHGIFDHFRYIFGNVINVSSFRIVLCIPWHDILKNISAFYVKINWLDLCTPKGRTIKLGFSFNILEPSDGK